MMGIVLTVKTEAGSVNGSPGIMSCFPTLACQQWFAAPLPMLVLYIMPKVGTNQVIACRDVEFPQQEVGSPGRILDVKDSQDSLAPPFWVCVDFA